jgi:hypothetical protein
LTLNPGSAQSLARKTFRVSRLAEFASTAELSKATGHPVERWPLVLVKELVDNSLDAAEEAGSGPEIDIVVDTDSITVAENGPGMPEDTVASIADYETRARAASSPAGDRGDASAASCQARVVGRCPMNEKPDRFDINEAFDDCR